MNAVLRKMTASDAVAVFLRAAEGMDPKIARAFIAAIETIRTRVPAEQIARMIERRDFTSLENAFSGHFTSTEWQPYGAAIQQAVLAGVKATSDTQGVINGAQEDFQIAVGLNPRLEQFALTMTSTRIREIDQTTRDTIRQVLQSGTTAGDDPFAIARRIRGSIGLTRRQEAAVSNYERMLRALDPEALDRKLRDRRSDGTVDRAIRNDKALTDAQVRSLVDRYRDRYIKYRANVIARTESIRAVQGAQWELFQDMINKGQIDARQVRRTWIHTGDGNVRNSHVQIPSLNPRGVGQAETFTSPLGPILYPGDPSAVAANTIQCRCAVFARIISRGLIPGLEEPALPPPAPPPPVRVSPPPPPVAAPAPQFAYKTLAPSKTVKEAIARMTGTIAARVELPSGAKLEMINKTHAAALEVQERFGFGPMGFLGNHKKTGVQYKWHPSAIAAFDMKRDFYLAAEKSFNDDYIDATIELSRNLASSYYAGARKTVNAGSTMSDGTIDNDVVTRFNQIKPASYKNTVQNDPKDVVYHELGHRFHAQLKADVDFILEGISANHWGLLLSKYSRTSKEELVAESFALYMQGDKSQFFRIYPPLLRLFQRLDKEV
jgi:hypothetical protein